DGLRRFAARSSACAPRRTRPRAARRSPRRRRPRRGVPPRPRTARPLDGTPGRGRAARPRPSADAPRSRPRWGTRSSKSLLPDDPRPQTRADSRDTLFAPSAANLLHSDTNDDGPSRARTGDLLDAIQTLSQLSYGPGRAQSSVRPRSRATRAIPRLDRSLGDRRLAGALSLQSSARATGIAA